MAKLKTGRHTGAIKAARQSIRRMLRNRTVKKRIRAIAKTFVEAASKKDVSQIQKLMPDLSSVWDKAAKTGAIHWKAAARKKSRLARSAAKLQAAGTAKA